MSTPNEDFRRALPPAAQVALDAAEQAGHEVHIHERMPRDVEVYSDAAPFDDALVLLLWHAGFRLRPGLHRQNVLSKHRYDHATLSASGLP